MHKNENPQIDHNLIKNFSDSYKKLQNQIANVIVGQKEIVEKVLISLFARGHVLIVGVPGLAKTLLISTIARALDLKFNRVQFTPDLMPSDITGTDIIEQDAKSGARAFRFIKGPIFSNILLADEINRTPPKTQAALLQAMQEYKVTVGGQTYELPQPFFVLATQNPIEQEGTYPLPEAQLDRFMFNVYIDYPDFKDEVEIVKNYTSPVIPEITPVLSAGEIMALQDLVRRVPVSDTIVNYAVKLSSMTRPGDKNAPDITKRYVSWGAGPRASLYLILGAKAGALLAGRTAVSIEDVNAVAHCVLRHRIITNFQAEADSIDSIKIMDEIIKRIEQQ
ncbi:MAG TPA: MoxR family ATPase [Candidatus Wallbacteria bacterium]|nr:MAG: replication factor C small subunit [bacterium ADurb.Bin243]HPG57191.1 MoxR family ATPase [Candidatus Wallbacteria bacterium]